MPHVDLLELPYFEGISLDRLVSLVDLMRPVSFEKNAVIMREGEGIDTPLIIATSGKVLITKSMDNGEPRSLARLQSPTLFGEIELFCQIPPVCSATATTPVTGFALDRPTFDELFASRNPAVVTFTFNVARVACHRLAIADEMLARVLTEEDLCGLRQTVFSRLNDDNAWRHTTGAFKVR